MYICVCTYIRAYMHTISYEIQPRLGPLCYGYLGHFKVPSKNLKSFLPWTARRAAAKGLQPRAAACHRVTTKFGIFFQFSKKLRPVAPQLGQMFCLVKLRRRKSKHIKFNILSAMLYFWCEHHGVFVKFNLVGSWPCGVRRQRGFSTEKREWKSV